ncbi:hypothetical protein ACXWR7_13265, partial [Streptococcus pyogenes]
KIDLTSNSDSFLLPPSFPSSFFFSFSSLSSSFSFPPSFPPFPFFPSFSPLSPSSSFLPSPFLSPPPSFPFSLLFFPPL